MNAYETSGQSPGLFEKLTKAFQEAYQHRGMELRITPQLTKRKTRSAVGSLNGQDVLWIRVTPMTKKQRRGIDCRYNSEPAVVEVTENGPLPYYNVAHILAIKVGFGNATSLCSRFDGVMFQTVDLTKTICIGDLVDRASELKRDLNLYVAAMLGRRIVDEIPRVRTAEESLNLLSASLKAMESSEDYLMRLYVEEHEAGLI